MGVVKVPGVADQHRGDAACVEVSCFLRDGSVPVSSGRMERVLVFSVIPGVKEMIGRREEAHVLEMISALLHQVSDAPYT